MGRQLLDIVGKGISLVLWVIWGLVQAFVVVLTAFTALMLIAMGLGRLTGRSAYPRL